MPYLLSLLPILIVLLFMLVFRWGGQRAGPAGWLVGILVAMLAFGLTPQVFWVSQVKGLLLSLYVLAVLWPALLLYNVVNRVGGIQALAQGLEQVIGDRGVLLIVLSWAFSGLLEGLAGFGLPIAVVAPMLAGLGIAPVIAVAAVAVGHAWAVTFGDMGVIFQTLISVVKLDGAYLAPAAALMLGFACVMCGLAAMRILNQGRHWLFVVIVALAMGITQGLLAVSGLSALGALGGGLIGVLCGILMGRRRTLPGKAILGTAHGVERRAASPALRAAMISYGGLTILMSAIALIQPVRAVLNALVWQIDFPEVTTLNGFATPAGPGQIFRPFVHPGTAILLVAIFSYLLFRLMRLCSAGSWRDALASTWHSAAPSSAGIIAMVGLATLMDHCGMTLLLARELSALMGAVFPFVSPLVGILGAFATGSNNNSNVLFGSLQKDAALLLGLDPRILLAAQTAGGSIGSMIAPAKIIVGCNTVGAKGRDGDVLRITLPYGLLIGLSLGALALIWSLLSR